jgi:hypothetical protein
MEYLFPSIIIVVVALLVLNQVFRQHKYDKVSVVSFGVEYPNNFHVMGVGYYHAASQKWFPQPWNEYREGRGYYWEGMWHPSPDQRMTQKSTPPQSEVDRVNWEWRKADPDRSRQFWETVEREGFGTAIRRSEGS